MPEDIEEQLIKHLTDAHSIEEQALTQMKRAPGIAGDARIAGAFEEHLEETERHEKRVRERLEDLDASPSKVKDLAGKAGGVGMVMFAKLNPDTPGKLVTHAYSYEHMELAAYELLERVAKRAGDERTAALAREIGAEEEAMAARLEGSFDRAVDASLGEHHRDDLDELLNGYLADAHAIEQQSVALLEGGQRIVGADRIAALFQDHLRETHEQERRVEARLEGRESSPSAIKDIGLRLGGYNFGGLAAAQPDTPAKLTGFAYAFEYLEVAAYEQLARVADVAGDAETATTARAIAAEEREMGAGLAARWDDAVAATAVEQGVSE